MIFDLVMGAVVMAILFIGFIYMGFWMGRHTVEKEIVATPPDDSGGQPVFEEDPYADALRAVKGEGSLK
jgi:hypothetical protein